MKPSRHGPRPVRFTGARRVPASNTLGRVLARIDADVLDAAVCRWLISRAGSSGSGRRLIAVDGKTLRGSGPAGAQVHLLAAVDHHDGPPSPSTRSPTSPPSRPDPPSWPTGHAAPASSRSCTTSATPPTARPQPPTDRQCTPSPGRSAQHGDQPAPPGRHHLDRANPAAERPEPVPIPRTARARLNGHDPTLRTPRSPRRVD